MLVMTDERGQGDSENTVICPLVGRSRPMRSLRSVVLPLPLGPTRAVMEPFGIAMVTSFNAGDFVPG